MGLEGLLTELLVATGLHGVNLKSVGVGVDKVILGEHVGDWHEGEADGKGHHENNLSVWNLGVTKIAYVLSNIVSHLWGR